MEETRGITVKVPAELHSRARQEQETLQMTMSSYITMILEEHFNGNRKDGKSMDGTRTLAFQVEDALFQQLKSYLAQHPGMTQKSFVIGLIKQALSEATTTPSDNTGEETVE